MQRFPRAVRLASSIVAAALLALPLAATAQTTTVVDQTNVVEKSTTVVVKEVPKTGVGKYDKKVVRNLYIDGGVEAVEADLGVR